MKKNNVLSKEYIGLSILSSLFTGILTMFILMCVFSMLISRFDISLWVIEPISTFIASFGALITGLTISLFIGKKGAILGFISGIVFFLIIIIFNLCIGTNTFSRLAIIKFTIFCLCGAIGGILGINIREKRRTRH